MHKIRLVQVYVSGRFPFWPSKSVFFTDHSLLSEQRNCSCSHHKQALSWLQSITPAKCIAAYKKVSSVLSPDCTVSPAGSETGPPTQEKNKNKKRAKLKCVIYGLLASPDRIGKCPQIHLLLVRQAGRLVLQTLVESALLSWIDMESIHKSIVYYGSKFH